MKPVLYNNEKTFRVLNKLVLSNYYTGNISPHRFKFKRNKFPNYYRIIGKLNKDNHFCIKSGYSWPMNIAVIIIGVLVILMCFVFFLKGQKVLPIMLAFLAQLKVLLFFFESRNEKSLFFDRFFQIESNEQ